MDYEKKIREYLNSSEVDKLYKSMLLNLFPELAESEDEKIRKAIYNCVKWFGFDSIRFKYVSQENCLAWLEKQGEHANFLNKIQIGDKVTRNEDGVLVNLSQLNRIAKKDKKQGEQKPTDNKGMNIDEECMTPFQKKVFCIIDTAIEEEQGLKQVCDELLALASNEIEQKPVVDDKDAEKASEEYRNFRMSCGIKDPVMLNEIEEAFYEGAIRKQKPVWSEEDKRNIERCITKIEIDKQNWEKNGNANTKTMVDADNELISWLKSIKDIVQPQTKQEWSEEDDDIIKCIQSDYRSKFGAGAITLSYYDKIIFWLKSLKERVQPQPKQEWGEEDEEIYRKCICAMRASACGFPEEEKFVEQVDNWLKSLKDRYTWKPSEGQLECLGYAIEKAEKDWSPLANNRIYLTLKALKEQLEKL